MESQQIPIRAVASKHPVGIGMSPRICYLVEGEKRDAENDSRMEEASSGSCQACCKDKGS